ncbi:MAG: hypothetical protein WCG47_33835 [Dermatophilaceae bacterium]
MAVTQSASSLRIRVDWEDAPGVASQELAATWCRFAMSVGDQSLTEVDADGVRAFLYLSAYPLAEWVAYMWWSLNWEIRVSDRPQRFWSWSHIEAQPWLRRHNLRGAGGGMPWPDVTLVPDGATTAVSWRGGPASTGVCAV